MYVYTCQFREYGQRTLGYVAYQRHRKCYCILRHKEYRYILRHREQRRMWRQNHISMSILFYKYQSKKSKRYSSKMKIFYTFCNVAYSLCFNSVGAVTLRFLFQFWFVVHQMFGQFRLAIFLPAVPFIAKSITAV